MTATLHDFQRRAVDEVLRIRGSEKARDFERRQTCGTDKCRERRQEVMA